MPLLDSLPSGLMAFAGNDTELAREICTAGISGFFA
jgi:hypothetical protein